jgi:hypothetical protein
MIEVQRSRTIKAASRAVFATLADPQNLANIVPRVRRIELVERGTASAKVVTHMALGPLGDLRSRGDVCWQADREIVFRSERPVLVEARWTLTELAGGTNLRATLSLDLSPLIGPFAALVPAAEVEKMIAPDLDTALAAIARRVEQGEGSI